MYFSIIYVPYYIYTVIMDRDDANLHHFKSRSCQPKTLASTNMSTPTNPMNVYVIFDSGFGSESTQIDDNRFKYMGTSPAATTPEKMSTRRIIHSCMNSGFT